MLSQYISSRSALLQAREYLLLVPAFARASSTCLPPLPRDGPLPFTTTRVVSTLVAEQCAALRPGSFAVRPLPFVWPTFSASTLPGGGWPPETGRLAEAPGGPWVAGYRLPVPPRAASLPARPISHWNGRPAPRRGRQAAEGLKEKKAGDREAVLGP